MRKDIIFDPQMTTYDMATLEEIVENLKPTHALEVGSWKGLSSSIIARHSKILYCVDTWLGADDEQHMVEEAKERSVLDVFTTNMLALGIKNVRPMVMSSQEASLLMKPDHLDFVYIDGDHQYDAVKFDLNAWFTLLKPGGVIAGHDMDEGHPGVVQAVKEKFSNPIRMNMKSSIWLVKKVA